MYPNISFSGVYIWNKIQDHINVYSTYSTFKDALKSFLLVHDLNHSSFVKIFYQHSHCFLICNCNCSLRFSFCFVFSQILNEFSVNAVTPPKISKNGIVRFTNYRSKCPKLQGRISHKIRC